MITSFLTFYLFSQFKIPVRCIFDLFYASFQLTHTFLFSLSLIFLAAVQVVIFDFQYLELSLSVSAMYVYVFQFFTVKLYLKFLVTGNRKGLVCRCMHVYRKFYFLLNSQSMEEIHIMLLFLTSSLLCIFYFPLTLDSKLLI